jgi:hypothetical protein
VKDQRLLLVLQKVSQCTSSTGKETFQSFLLIIFKSVNEAGRRGEEREREANQEKDWDHNFPGLLVLQLLIFLSFIFSNKNMDGVKNNKKLLNDPCISQHLRHR